LILKHLSVLLPIESHNFLSIYRRAKGPYGGNDRFGEKPMFPLWTFPTRQSERRSSLPSNVPGPLSLTGLYSPGSVVLFLPANLLFALLRWGPDSA